MVPPSYNALCFIAFNKQISASTRRNMQALPFFPQSVLLTSLHLIVSSIVNFGLQYGRMFSPVGRNFMFCQRRYHFCSFVFVSGKVDSSSIVLRQSSLSIHEPNFRRADFILELVGLRDGNLFLCHTPPSFLAII
jgi:hypothetical protein